MKYKTTKPVAHNIHEHQTGSLIEDTPQTQAREWLTYLYSGHITSGKREEFIRWIDSNEENRKAFRHSHDVWKTIGMTDSAVEWLEQYSSQNSIVQLQFKPKHSFAKLAVLLSGIAASVAFLVLNDALETTDSLKITPLVTVFNSPVGGNRTITLSDGSDVTLAGNSSISVYINQHARRITLRKGSAYFDVTHDPTRIFSVTAQHTQVRVRGTAFEVKHSIDNAIKVSVQRGLVEVADLPEQGVADEKIIQLRENEQLRANSSGAFITEVTQFNPQSEFSWLSERLIYDDIPLKTVIMDINRYAKKPVVILDESINDLSITASFTFEQIDQMLAGLAFAYPITLIEEDTRSVLVKQ
jgi:transmembrane sensor